MMLLNGIIGQVNIQILFAFLITIEFKTTRSDVSFLIPVSLDMIVLK